MGKWKKVCKGCLPFIAALLGIYVLTVVFLFIIVFLWSMVHYEQMSMEGSTAADLILNETWLNQVIIWINCIIYFIFIAGFGSWYKKITKDRSEKRKKVFCIPNLLGCLVLGISMQYFFSYALNLFLPLFPKINSQYKELLDSMGMGKGFVTLFYVGILAPVAEELIFRGLILNYEKKELPFWAANLIQALCFGIYHQNIVQFTYTFFVGLLLGYLYAHFESLPLVMWVHAVINISGNLLMYFQLLPLLEQKTAMAIICMISLLFVVLSYLFLIKRKADDS